MWSRSIVIVVAVAVVIVIVIVVAVVVVVDVNGDDYRRHARSPPHTPHALAPTRFRTKAIQRISSNAAIPGQSPTCA